MRLGARSITASSAKALRLIPDNEYVIFGHSSHCVILEKEAGAYLGVIRDFIQRLISRT